MLKLLYQSYNKRFTVGVPILIVRESVEFAALVAAAQAGIPHARVAVHNGFVEERFMPKAYVSIDALHQEVRLRPDNGASLRAEPVFTSFPSSLDGVVKVTGQTPFRVAATQVITASDQATAAWKPKDGERLVYITFGTIAGSSSDRHVIYRNVMSSVEDLSIRVLLTTGRGMEASALGTIPRDVTVRAWVPQNEV